MKKITLLIIPFATLLFAFVQQEPIKKEQLISTEDLAKKLTDQKAIKPVIFNVGPVNQIKTAIKVGAVSTAEGFAKFKTEVAKISKDKEIVVYCGCCSSQNCPNIRPAIKYLNDNGYKKSKILDIPTGIKEDWVQKDYPIEK